VGDSYARFNKVVSIVIADFNFIDDDPNDYYHRYLLYDKERDSQFTDLMEIDIIELKKVPAEPDHTAKWGWTRFFGSGSDAELRAAAKERDKIGKAMLTIEKLSADETARRRAEYEEMMRRDYVSRMEGAKREGLSEGEAKGFAKGEAKGRVERDSEIAQRLVELGKTEAEIAEILGYSGGR
jgi:predicted transposase/invertase (TIGR01784 family)